MTKQYINGELVDLSPEDQSRWDANNTPEALAARVEASIEAEVSALFDVATKRDKAIGEMMWQIAKAAKTDNWTYFDTVNSKGDFRELFKDIIRGF